MKENMQMTTRSFSIDVVHKKWTQLRSFAIFTNYYYYIKTSNTLLKIKIIINVDKYTHAAWHGYHRIFFLDSDFLQLLWFREKAKIDHYYISIRKSCCFVYIIKKYGVQDLQILIIIYVKTYKSCLFYFCRDQRPIS